MPKTRYLSPLGVFKFDEAAATEAQSQVLTKRVLCVVEGEQASSNGVTVDYTKELLEAIAKSSNEYLAKGETIPVFLSLHDYETNNIGGSIQSDFYVFQIDPDNLPHPGMTDLVGKWGLYNDGLQIVGAENVTKILHKALRNISVGIDLTGEIWGEGNTIYEISFVPWGAIKGAMVFSKDLKTALEAGVDGEEDAKEIKDFIKWYAGEADKTVKHAPDKSLTNFPSEGEDKEITLSNSNYPQFDYGFAKNIRDNFPNVWKRGGNIRGNQAFNFWGMARNGTETQGTEAWIKEREGWAARHQNDYRLAGVMASAKWGVIVAKGEEYMKQTLQEAIDKEVAKNQKVAEDEGIEKYAFTIEAQRRLEKVRQKEWYEDSPIYQSWGYFMGAMAEIENATEEELPQGFTTDQLARKAIADLVQELNEHYGIKDMPPEEPIVQLSQPTTTPESKEGETEEQITPQQYTKMQNELSRLKNELEAQKKVAQDEQTFAHYRELYARATKLVEAQLLTPAVLEKYFGKAGIAKEEAIATYSKARTTHANPLELVLEILEANGSGAIANFSARLGALPIPPNQELNAQDVVQKQEAAKARAERVFESNKNSILGA